MEDKAKKIIDASEARFIWTMLYRVVKMEKWIINIPSHTFGMGTSEDFTIIIH